MEKQQQVEVVKLDGGILGVKAPYSPALIAKFKSFGLKWQKPHWVSAPGSNQDALVSNLLALFGSGQIESRTYFAGALISTGGQLMLGGYLVATISKDGRIGLGDGVNILSGTIVSTKSGPMPSADLMFSIHIPVNFDWTKANLDIIPAPEYTTPFKRKKKPSEATTEQTGTAVPLPASGKSEQVIMLESALMLTLGLLENAYSSPREVQQHCRAALGWSDGADLPLMVDFCDGDPVPAATELDPMMAAPSGSVKPSQGDTFAQLQAMFG